MLDTARHYRRDGQSPVKTVRDLLLSIEIEPYNAFISYDEEGALQDAEKAERAIEKGSEELLMGLPIAVKDNICTKGLPTTCASLILEHFVPTYDAHVIERLKVRGAVIIGKTNLDEFAMGSTTATSCKGPTKNPWDITRTPGGSSGGSAAAVAAGLCAGALGSDTGGSVRMPASFCGITGLKPTYGAVSRYGLVAFASSLDQIGPMTRTARDAAVLFDAIRGHDPQDSTSLVDGYPPLSLNGNDLSGVRIGVPKVFFGEGLAHDVERSVRYAQGVFEELGAVIVEVDLPHLAYGVAVYYIICTAEASSNLARYDGIRYGRRAAADTLIDTYLNTRTQGFNAEVKRRIMLGTYVLSAGYYDQYYRKASQVRSLIVKDFVQAFEHCDMLLGPTTPCTAFGLTEMLDDPLSLYLLDIYTIPANLSGLPAISIPCGFGDTGLPIGMQLMAPALREDLLLGAGIAFQDVTSFHKVKPR